MGPLTMTSFETLLFRQLKHSCIKPTTTDQAAVRKWCEPKIEVIIMGDETDNLCLCTVGCRRRAAAAALQY